MYEYMEKVPLHGKPNSPIVTVVRYREVKEDRVRKWMWVTDLKVTPENIKTIVKGGRTQWKIENETFNTLKNQGYKFEHNFGHGKRYLNQVFTQLMMITFLVDQCLQKLNKRFGEALVRSRGKKYLWRRMLNSLTTYYIPGFETLYEAIARPPPIFLKAVV